jgi:hypothetical protein
MDKPRQPIFNRTYLKITPWIVAIVIVLLTANSQKNTSYLPEALHDNWIFLSVDEATTKQQLKLLYPVPPAYNEQQTQQRIALQTALSDALRAQDTLTTEWNEDKLILSIMLDQIETKTFNLNTLLSQLAATANNNYPAALQRATAERYLALNDIETLALSTMKTQLLALQPPAFATPTDISSLFYARPTALIILKKKNDSLTTLISEQLKDRYSSTTESHIAALTPESLNTASLAANKLINLQHRSNTHLYLIGQPISVSANNLTRILAFRYINQALKPLIEKNNATYHLMLKPFLPVGYAALVITRNSPLQEKLPNNLEAYLLEHFDTQRLEQIKIDLSSQYEFQLADPEQRPSLLARQLFYKDKFQSVDEFHGTLAGIPATQIQTQIHQLFDPAHAIIVRITPP